MRKCRVRKSRPPKTSRTSAGSNLHRAYAKVVLEEGGSDREEDAFDLCVRHVAEGEHVHVPQHSIRDWLPSAAWRAHCGEQRHVDDSLHSEYLPVVPPSVIDHLPHQLDWRLCAVRLPLRHIQVVEEDDELLSEHGAPHRELQPRVLVGTLPPLLKLIVEDVLWGKGRRAVFYRRKALSTCVWLADVCAEKDMIIGSYFSSIPWVNFWVATTLLPVPVSPMITVCIFPRRSVPMREA